MEIPVTGLSHLVFSILLLVALQYIRSRMRQAGGSVLPSVRYMYRYFLYFLVFNLLMCIPHAAVLFAPERFSTAMAWGYVLANVFLIISLSYLARMATLVSTRFAGLEKYVTVLWAGINIAVTALHYYVVVVQKQPYLHPDSNVTTFDFPPYMGPILGTVSLAAYVPAIILFGISAVKNRGGSRKRAILLTLGMILIMLSGPMHAIATNWQMFVMIDIVNGISLALLAAGIAYQLAEKPTAKQPAAANAV